MHIKSSTRLRYIIVSQVNINSVRVALSETEQDALKHSENESSIIDLIMVCCNICVLLLLNVASFIEFHKNAQNQLRLMSLCQVSFLFPNL